MSLRFAYNTNGLLSHRLEDALELVGETGYHGVALTLDHVHLDPLRAGPSELIAARRLLREHRLRCCIETGARFALDPRRKHAPGLCDPDPLQRMRRVDYLVRSVEVAAELEAEVLNLAAGPRDLDQDVVVAERFLIEGLREVLARGEALGVPIALEPEPNHWIDTLVGYEQLLEHFPELMLTIDVSHVSIAVEEGSAAEAIRAHANRLALVHVEDAPRGRHEHLPFGEGELDIAGIIEALEEIEFQGLVAVELSRHSHAAHELVPRSLQVLQAGGTPPSD